VSGQTAYLYPRKQRENGKGLRLDNEWDVQVLDNDVDAKEGTCQSPHKPEKSFS
jgi:hypothetical protein